jgi:hypothetical protein
MANDGTRRIGRMRPVLACLILAAVLVTGNGATAADTHRMEGNGNASCGNWTEARAPAPGGGMTQDHPLQAQWVLGFLTGVGVFGRTFDPLKNVDAQGVVAWMDNYCQANPLDSIGTAAADFVLQHPR